MDDLGVPPFMETPIWNNMNSVLDSINIHHETLTITTNGMWTDDPSFIANMVNYCCSQLIVEQDRCWVHWVCSSVLMQVATRIHKHIQELSNMSMMFSIRRTCPALLFLPFLATCCRPVEYLAGQKHDKTCPRPTTPQALPTRSVSTDHFFWEVRALWMSTRHPKSSLAVEGLAAPPSAFL